MKKFPMLAIAATLVIIVGGVFLVSKNQSSPAPLPPFNPEVHTYFWGNGCPHCETVKKFFDSWDKKDEIEIDKKEVWYNKGNASLMTKVALETCNIPQKELAVPLLVTPDGKCFMGDTPMIEYFKSL